MFQENNKKQSNRGFLPFKTNTFDRVFVSVVILIAIHLLWMRFLEQYASIYIATVISVFIGFYVVRKG